MARILVVEDDPTQRKLIETFMKMGGHEVLIAGTVEQGMTALQLGMTDLLIVDVLLPGKSGIDLCRTLRSQPTTRDLYILLATVSDDPEIKEQGEAAGADDFVHKPLRCDELLGRVRVGLRVKDLQGKIRDLESKLRRLERRYS